MVHTHGQEENSNGKTKRNDDWFPSGCSGIGRKRQLARMYTGRNIRLGFFAWVIPTGDSTHRIGIWSKADLLDGKSMEQCYDSLISHELWKDRFANVKEISR